MGRPSLAEQRQAEILEGFERCVLRDGIAHTTMTAIAKEIGCQRTLINHYFGGTDELVRALVEKLTEDQRREFREFSSASKKTGAALMVDYLFRRLPKGGNALVRALRADGGSSANESLAKMYQDSARLLGTFLQREIPGATPARCRATATSIVCLAMSRFQLSALGVRDRELAGLRASAETLIDALESG
ncbi:MAG: TetR/AcrR family transcriptional regulator [Myxococcota bacterium]